MKILLIAPNHMKGFRPSMPIGMITIANALIETSHEVRCLDLCFDAESETRLKKEINSFSPDIVGFSIRNIDNQNFLDPFFILESVKRHIALIKRWKDDITVILGGPAFTLLPEEMMRYLKGDYGIAGPGEVSFIEVIKCIETGKLNDINKVPGVIYKSDNKYIKNKISNNNIVTQYLNSQNHNLYDKRYFSSIFNGPTFHYDAAYPIIGKRGCIYSCIYCANSLIAGTKLQLRPPKEIVDDIEIVIKNTEAKSFEFVDGAFNAPYEHAYEICKEMKKRNLNFPWLCMFTPGNSSEYLVDLMAETGCIVAELGSESGSDIILKNLNKKFRKEKIIETHNQLLAKNIKTEHCLFLGSPGETIETLKETFDLLNIIIPPDIKTRNRAFLSLGYRIFKGTNIYNMAIKNNIINENDSLLVPHFYIEPNILKDEMALEYIQENVTNNSNWFLWWGFDKYTLKEQVQIASKRYNEYRSMVNFSQ